MPDKCFEMHLMVNDTVKVMGRIVTALFMPSRPEAQLDEFMKKRTW